MKRRGLLLAGFSAVAAAAKDDGVAFPIVRDEVCLNNAHWHPISAGAMRAAQKFLEFKSHGFGSYAEYGVELQKQVRGEFAKLIGARTEEISYVPSTMGGENLVVNGMLPDLAAGGGNIVTDALHFEGSLYLYGELAKKGIDVRVVQARENRIHLADLERVIDRKTKLVAVSLVSMFNGFQHDLKAVCELAHSRGAVVYADIIQAAGAVPLDVTQSGVDFCACASYKWLMGDMGVGFLYARADRLGAVVRKSVYGYRQPSATGAAAYFEVGTIANTVIACLSYSLPYLRKVGVATIQAQRQPLVDRIQKEVASIGGFRALTPAGSTSPIVSFARENARRDLLPRLRAAKVNIEVYEHRVRVSPSIYNTQADVDRLLNCLQAAG